MKSWSGPRTGIRLKFWDRSQICHSGFTIDKMAIACRQFRNDTNGCKGWICLNSSLAVRRRTPSLHHSFHLFQIFHWDLRSEENIKTMLMFGQNHSLTVCAFFSCRTFQWCSRHLGSPFRGLLKSKKSKCAVTHSHLPLRNLEFPCFFFSLLALAGLSMAPYVIWCFSPKPAFSCRSSASCKSDSLLRRNCCLKVITDLSKTIWCNIVLTLLLPKPNKLIQQTAEFWTMEFWWSGQRHLAMPRWSNQLPRPSSQGHVSALLSPQGWSNTFFEIQKSQSQTWVSSENTFQDKVNLKAIMAWLIWNLIQETDPRCGDTSRSLAMHLPAHRGLHPWQQQCRVHFPKGLP